MESSVGSVSCALEKASRTSAGLLMIFERSRKAVRTALRERERVRFARTRAFGMARRMFTAIGAGLARSGALAGPRDVFHLKLEEIRGAFTGTISHRELRPLAQLRRDQQDKQRQLPARMTAGNEQLVPTRPRDASE